MSLNPFKDGNTEDLKNALSHGKVFPFIFILVFIVTGLIRIPTSGGMGIPEQMSLFWMYFKLTLIMPDIIILIFMVHLGGAALVSGLLSLFIRK